MPDRPARATPVLAHRTACDSIGEGTLVFSPDSQRIAYTAQKGKRWHLVIDGRFSPPYDVIGTGSPSFRADGSLEALVVRDKVLYRVECAAVPRS